MPSHGTALPHYAALNHQTREIRVLEISSSLNKSDSRHYAALPYRRSNDAELAEMDIQGSKLASEPNLFEALRELHASADGLLRLWADANGINRFDRKERGH